MSEEARRRIAGWYLVAQGLATFAWWIAMARWLPFRDRFIAPDGWPAARTILAADVVLVGGGSLAIGLLILGRHRHSGRLGLVLVGATAYATVVSAAWVRPPVDRWWGLIVMLGALAATTLAVGQADAGRVRSS